MPGILEDIAAELHAVKLALAELAEQVRASALPVCPMLPEEEVWADGPLSVTEACEFLKVKKSKLFELMRSGKIVSAIDGRRLIAKRDCVRSSSPTRNKPRVEPRLYSSSSPNRPLARLAAAKQKSPPTPCVLPENS